MSALTRAAYGLDSGREVDWRQKAACREYNPDWWTALADSIEAKYAARVCEGCPVLAACDAWAQKDPRRAAGAVYAGKYYPLNAPPLVLRAMRLPDEPATRMGWRKMPIDRIRELAGQGWTDTQIAAALGSTTKASVQKTRQNHRIPSGKSVREAA